MAPPRKAPPAPRSASPLDQMTEAQRQEAREMYEKVCEGLDEAWRLNATMRDLLSEPGNAGVSILLIQMRAEARVEIMKKMLEGKMQAEDVQRQQADVTNAQRRTRRAVDQDQVDGTTAEPRPQVNAPEEIILDPMQRTLDEWNLA